MLDMVIVKNPPWSGNRFDAQEEHFFLFVLGPYLSALTYMCHATQNNINTH
jgi:hypothetical protein